MTKSSGQSRPHLDAELPTSPLDVCTASLQRRIFLIVPTSTDNRLNLAVNTTGMDTVHYHIKSSPSGSSLSEIQHSRAAPSTPQPDCIFLNDPLSSQYQMLIKPTNRSGVFFHSNLWKGVIVFEEMRII